MSSRFTKKSLVSVSGRLGEDAVLGLSGVGIQDAQAADEHRHLRCGQRQQLRPINQQLFCRYAVFGFEIVAEPIGGRLEHGKGFHIGLLLRRIRASRREGHSHIVPGVLRRLLDGCATAKDNQVRERNLLAAGLVRR